MTNWKRRFTDDLSCSELDALRSAVWNGRCWSIPSTAPAVLERLTAEGLVEERSGMWVLTINGHRHRRVAVRPAGQRKAAS